MGVAPSLLPAAGTLVATLRVLPLVLGLLWPATAGAQPAPGSDGSEWIEIDYSGVVDLRRLSHSGESIEMLLDRLGGRGLPPPGERPADRLPHVLLDPLLEPYAFVLADALDSLAPVAQPPLVEVGPLWQPGEVQPAWVELLRARRYLVESDGRGRLRACVPWTGQALIDPQSGKPLVHSATAAEQAWKAAWPVLRHVLAAERRRLAGERGGDPQDHPLDVEVHVYRHLPERLAFQLGLHPHRVTVTRTGPDGARPVADLAGMQEFLDRGWRIEGGRLEPDGTLRLLGSQTGPPATMLGSAITLADFAVAYRAVFHGGLSEPYMSLDRGSSPQTSVVNYGGRLRDTRLGWVSLLCDIRFKTFSLGLGILEARDLRSEIRQRIPDFRTHLEQFAADPGSRGVSSQQTRLWFYPDDVDLTISPQGDVLVMRRVRMTAASERVQEETFTAAGTQAPSWTRKTVAGINQDYDRLAALFPELAELDEGVRLLSLFTWLKLAAEEGRPIPDLDVLLALELPEVWTPRTFPQLLAFNALPPNGGDGVVESFDRVAIAEALEQLNPSSGASLPARQRLDRALQALHPTDPQHQALIDELRGIDLAGLSSSALDLLTYRAERLRMHRTVLTTLPAAQSDGVAQRLRDGERLRIFSVGIGGLDLGMRKVLSRASGRSRGLDWGATGSTSQRSPAPAAGSPAPPAGDPALLPATRMPDHGLGAAGEESRVEVVRSEAGRPTAVQAVWGADGPGARSRRLLLDGQGKADVVERYERGAFVRFRLRARADRLRAVPVEAVQADRPETGTQPGQPVAGGSGALELPAGLALVRVPAAPDVTVDGRGAAVGPPPAGARAGGRAVRLQLSAPGESGAPELESEFAVPELQRLVMGRQASPGASGIDGLVPLPRSLAGVQTLMLLLDRSQTVSPWIAGPPVLAGESDPLRLAEGLRRWSISAPDPASVGAAVVGTDPSRSPERWSLAPRASRKTLLLLPQDGFPPPYDKLRARLSDAWTAGEVVSSLPAKKIGTLLVLVSAEPPDLFGARLRSLAHNPALRGKLLAFWSLAGPVRPDLPASLLAEGNLAGLGFAKPSVVGTRRAEQQLAAFSATLGDPDARRRRVESLDGPFLWIF